MDEGKSGNDEVAALRAENARLKKALAEQEALVSMLIDHNPDGVVILDAQGASVRSNAAGNAITGDVATTTGPDAAMDAWGSKYGFFRPDRTTRMQVTELGAIRALAGEIVVDELLWMVGPSRPQGFMLSTSARPIPQGGVICVFRDVTQRVDLEADLAARNEALARREAENRELIERLRVALDELSTPVLEIGESVLVLPVIGLVDTQRSAQMTERLLAEVVRTKARHVIIDLTGVEIVDTSTADRFGKLARAVGLLGARCMLTGIQPAVAQTLVELGVELSGFGTQRNLGHALQACMRADAAAAGTNGSHRRAGAQKAATD